MALNLLEELILLALDDDKGTFLTDSIHFNHTITGAVLILLVMDKAISIEDKNVVHHANVIPSIPYLQPTLKKISESKKTRSLEYWFHTLAENASKTINECIMGLIEKGILNKKEGKILWFFNNPKYPTNNTAPENELKNRLSLIIEARKTPNQQELIMLQFIELCELGKNVFGKETYNKNKLYLKELIKKQALPNEITDQIIATQSAIIAAIATTTAAIAVTIIINT